MRCLATALRWLWWLLLRGSSCSGLPMPSGLFSIVDHSPEVPYSFPKNSLSSSLGTSPRPPQFSGFFFFFLQWLIPFCSTSLAWDIGLLDRDVSDKNYLFSNQYLMKTRYLRLCQFRLHQNKIKAYVCYRIITSKNWERPKRSSPLLVSKICV